MSDITLRPMVDADFDVVVALHQRADAHDGRPVVTTLEEMREELDDEHVVLATDVRLALLDGEVVGYLYTYHLPSDVALERCYLFGDVDPAARGRGVGRALLTWGIERATEQLRSSGSALPKVVRVDGREIAVVATLQSPRLVVFGQLLSDEECDALVALARPRLERSQTVAHATGGSEVNAARTSDGMFFRRGETSLIERIEQRIAGLLQWPV